MLKKALALYSLVLIFATIQISAADQIGPLDDSGEINGAPYRIVVPANWNGTLLVYAHGYRDKADHPGEVDARAADVAPNAALVPALLAQGYALAGSAYRDNGWEVEGGVQDLKDLTVYFKDNIAQPDRTILWAFSMGTVIGFDSMERFHGIYDGALCACAVGAGATQTWDAGTDFLVGYDVLFGMPGTWGSPADIRDDIDFETEAQPKLISEVSNPANFPKFEFLRLVVGIPGRGITPPPPPNFYPGSLFTEMFFATEARAELERRAGAPFVQNLDRNYSLSPEERLYLTVGLGVPSVVVDTWLAQMNGNRTISSPPFSRNYVERNANYSGKIKAPVLTMHTVVDPLVTVSQSAEYADTVGTAGRGRFLKQTYTNGIGHCNFTGPQLITAVNAINGWVTTGQAPPDSAFPAALSFVPGFIPPRMLQP